MDSDLIGSVPTTCPEYILPGDPPDMKPDLKMLKVKDEPHDRIPSRSPTAADDPLDVKPDLKMLKVKDESHDLVVNIHCEHPRIPGRSPTAAGGVTLCCVHCDVACMGQEHLDRHVTRWHSDIGSFLCDRPYRCDVCGKAFKKNSDLTRHKRIHTGEKVRECDRCGATFNQLSHYTMHMMSHNGVKEHRCKVCSARFVRRQHLTNHMRIHSGERPYSCSFCAARFSRKSLMQSHAIVFHTHNYRHRCDRCGKGFTAPVELKKHVDKCSVAVAYLEISQGGSKPSRGAKPTHEGAVSERC